MRVPRLILGTVSFHTGDGLATARRIVERCLEQDLTWIDTAPSYGDGASERAVGQILRDTGARSQVVLAGKFGLTLPEPSATAAEIESAIVAEVEGSLGRLGTDHLDLLQLHRPWFGIHPEVVLAPLGRLVRAGKVRAIGSSNLPAWLIAELNACAAATGDPAIAIQQSPYNLLDRRIENDLIDFCARRHVTLVTWSPTASGMLSGRYRHGSPPPADSRASWVEGFTSRLTRRNLEVVDALARRAAEQGLSIAQLALAWTLAQRGVAGVIIGPRTLAHLEDSLGALAPDFSLAPDPEIDEIVPPGGYVVDFATLSRPVPAELAST